MKHFVIFKLDHNDWKAIYEYHGSLVMARKFQRSLSDSMKSVLILCEVV